MEKRCTLCHQLKPVDLFYKDASTATGYTSACKSCRSKQVSRAESKRLKRSKGQVIEETTELLDHNYRALKNALDNAPKPYDLTFKTKLVEAIEPIPKGLVFKSGWAIVETYGGKVSVDLTKVSLRALARLLETNLVKILQRELNQ